MAVRQRGKARNERSKQRDGQNSQREKIGGAFSFLEKLDTQRMIWIVVIAVGAALFHSAHLHALFENDRYFSHLSSLERELSFRTEMGLYYSYYKELVESPSLTQGWTAITEDNITEYPNTINTLKRFNLYPEVILSLLHRAYSSLLLWLGVDGVECFKISRGYNQPPITACNGLGDVAYFYVWWIFAINGIFASFIFLLSTYISKSILGGILALMMFVFNHGEATRVMWTPPLRESFAMPFLMLQMIVFTYILRQAKPGKIHCLLLTLSSLIFMLPWQFAQFVLLTQQLSLLAVYSITLIGPAHFLCITTSLCLALAVNIVLQFGNTLLLTSFLPPCLMVCLVVGACHKIYAKVQWLLLRASLQVVSVAVGTVVIKQLFSWLLQAKDDAHIGAILLSKFTSYRDFHTQLYTCAAEFDFLPLEYALKLTVTLLIPASLAAACLVTKALINLLWLRKPVAVDNLAEVTYIVIQALPFTVLAVLIMRLKLFLTPHLAVMSSLLAHSQVSVKDTRKRVWLVGLLLASSAVGGVYNVWNQWNILGEFNSPDQEELVQWINSSTSPHAVFAGAMPTMATVKLTTGRPIVNHPHYEDAALRERTMKVYTIYSHKPPEVVHSTLKELKVTHVIIEDIWCSKQYRPGCALHEVWNELDPVNQDQPVFCETIRDNIPNQFKLVFINKSYRILHLV